MQFLNFVLNAVGFFLQFLNFVLNAVGFDLTKKLNWGLKCKKQIVAVKFGLFVEILSYITGISVLGKISDQIKSVTDKIRSDLICFR